MDKSFMALLNLDKSLTKNLRIESIIRIDSVVYMGW